MKNMQNRYLIVIAIMLLASVLVHFLSYDTYYEAEAGIRAINLAEMKKTAPSSGYLRRFLEKTIKVLQIC